MLLKISTAAQFAPSKNSAVFGSTFSSDFRNIRTHDATIVRNHAAQAPGP
jgi:hypothetical protein